ncbi:MAG: MFS transporter [Candidatus Neomarinimicrobiota bacterium]
MNELSLRDQTRNLVLNCVHEGSWGFGAAFHNAYAIIPLFLYQLNAPQGVVISVAGLFSIMMAVPQLITAVMGRNIRNIKLAVLGVHTLVWPPIFIAGFTFAFFAPSGPQAWVFYYICFILYGLAIGMILPIWADFLTHVTQKTRRGTFLGISFAFNSLGGFAGGLVSKALLSSTISFPRNFGWGFLITFGALIVGTLVFIFYKVKTPADVRPHRTVPEFWAEIRAIIRTHTNFRRYIVSRIFFTASFPAISLYAIYAQDRFNFDISEAGIFTAINTIAFGLASYFSGRLGDRYGHKTALVLSMCLHLSALTLALVAPSMSWIYLVFAFLGAGLGSFIPASMNLLYGFAGHRDNKTIMALIDTSLAPFTFLAIMLAGSLSHIVSIPAVLIGLGGSMLISAGLLVITVRDPGTEST